MKSAWPALLLAVPLLATAQVQHLNPSTLSPPHGYSHVVAVAGGRMLFIAGQVPLDKNGKLVGAGDVAAQTRQAFENLKAALAAGGADFSNVVEMTTYVTDMAQVGTYRKIRDEYMSNPLPAASLVEVKGLFRKDVMLEVSAMAVVPPAPAPAASSP